MTRKVPDVLKSLSFSDIHIGNPRVPATIICDNLRTMISPHLETTDLIFLGGDLWDRAISLSEDASHIGLDFCLWLLNEADRHHVTIRVLRGTWSHDRDQCCILKRMHTANNYKNSLEYFDKITLEYIESLNIRVLYLPDDLPYESSEDVMYRVQTMMRERGWDTVDYANVHGYFAHVVPEGAHTPKITFTKEQFSFVTRAVLIGHVHTSSVSGMFFYNGSTERLSHGEEEPKGMLLVTDTPQRVSVKFIENKHALTFKTIDLSYCTAPEEATLAFIKAVEKHFPNTDSLGYVRVIHPNKEIKRALAQYTKQNLPHLTYTHLDPKDKKEEKRPEPVLHMTDITTLISPTKDTLPEMIFDFLKGKTSLSIEDISARLTLLSEG